MIPIIKEKRQPSFREQLLGGLGDAATEASQQLPRYFGERMMAKEQQQRQAQGNRQFQDMFGVNLEGYSPDERKVFIQKMLESQNQQAKQQFAQQIKEQERIRPLQNALQTLERQKQLLASGHLGPAFSFTGQGRKAGSTLSPEGQKARGEYRRLGTSLVQAAAPLIIRNKAEFEKYADGISDPNASQAEIEGNLKGLERIIRQNIGETMEEEGDTIEMKDSEGNPYDIPKHLQAQARAKGLR